ncbi:MAG: hypothetical protein M3460_14535 [Actinomycetota bacterium]|nr:hypothetical protein [Actinomycetota bacterium]
MRDGGWGGVAGAGGLTGFLDPVVVVPGSFDRAGAGAFAAWWDEQGGDQRYVGRELVSPVRRGEWSPSRWRYGGSGAGPG